MWSSRLFWKLFGTFAAATLASAATLVIVVSSWQQERATQLLVQQLDETAVLLEGHVVRALASGEEPAALKRSVAAFARGIRTRCTVIDPDGTVLADTAEDPARMDNHKNRPEFVQAAAGETGISLRVSPTLQIPMLFVARAADDGPRRLALVRTALPLDELERETAAIRRSVWGIAALITGAALVVIWAIVYRIVQPVTTLTQAARAMAAGDHVERIAVSNRDEFGTLAEAFRAMSGQLATRLAELRRTAQRLRTVLGSMVEGVIALDSRRRIVFANQAAIQLLSLPSPEPEGKPLWELVRSPALERVVDEALAGQMVRRLQIDLDGRPPRTLALSITELPGDSPGLVLVFHDVSELRRLERLRQDFVANVSHELKTPLASIKAYAETLLGGALDDHQHNTTFVRRISEQAERLDTLIRDLLSLAQIESGQQPLERVAIDLGRTLPRWAEEHRSAAEAKRISLGWEAPPAPVYVLAEAEGLRQILDNLLANAIKYTPDGGQVIVRWRRHGNEAVLEVEDTGIGIARSEQQRIFERFYRVDRARSRELGGTGLGLSIVKHLAQSFGGSVTVRSQVGRGSVFSVVLPAVEPAGDEIGQPIAAG